MTLLNWGDKPLSEGLRITIERITYKNWCACAKCLEDDLVGLRVMMPTVDVRDGKPTELYSQSIRLHSGMRQSEVIKALFKCIEELELHEAAEQFQFKGARVYDPHLTDRQRKELLEFVVYNA